MSDIGGITEGVTVELNGEVHQGGDTEVGADAKGPDDSWAEPGDNSAEHDAYAAAEAAPDATDDDGNPAKGPGPQWAHSDD